MKSRYLTIRATEDLRTEFQHLCEASETTVSAELRAYMKKCVEQKKLVGREYKPFKGGVHV